MTNRDDAVDRARQVQRWEDQDFVAEVSPCEVREHGDDPSRRWSRSWTTGSRRTSSAASAGAALRVRVLPHTASPADVLAGDVAGVVLSAPAPGDPARLAGPVALARAIIEDGRPLLGICLGHQIVGRAAGADTRRLRFGHHGANHPVQDLDTGYVQVTAQNHEVQVVADGAARPRPGSGSAS